MSVDLTGKVALVTGGSRGIGLRIVRTFAAHGADVILLSRSGDEALGALSKSLSSEYGCMISYVSGDVSDTAVASTAVKKAFTDYKRLDVVVNNAGILDDAILGMIAEDAIDRTLATNVKGVINFTQAAARLMARNKSGSIINLSSIIGRYGNPGQVVYGASKAAVIGATLSAAKELAPQGIRVNAIAPGYIDTDMIGHLDAETDRQRRESIGMKRIGDPQDVANTALFLASDLSSYVTGQVIGVDGGMVV